MLQPRCRDERRPKQSRSNTLPSKTNSHGRRRSNIRPFSPAIEWRAASSRSTPGKRQTALRRRTVRPSQPILAGGRLMGREDSDPDHACTAFVFSWSRFSTCSSPGRLKTCPTELRRSTRSIAEPHAESDTSPQSLDRCCRQPARRRSRCRHSSSRTRIEQPNQPVTRSRSTTDRTPPLGFQR